MAENARPAGDASRSERGRGATPATSSENAIEREEDVLGAAPTEPAAKKRRFRLPLKGDGQRKPLRLSRKAVIVIAVVLVPIIIVVLAPVIVRAFKTTPRDKYGISYTGG